MTQVRERAFRNAPEKAAVSDAELLGGSNYDYGRRDTYATTYEGGSDIKYGRFLDELGWEFMQESHADKLQSETKSGILMSKMKGI